MPDFALWGAVVNAVTVAAGASVGLLLRFLFRRGKRTAENGEAPTVAENGRGAALSDAVMKAVGLCVVLIGMQGALATANVLAVIVSLAVGTLLGTLLDLDKLVNRAAKAVEKKLHREGGRLAEGFVSATMLFCIGAMTVTGAIESGVSHVHTTYYAKSMLDMISAAVFASALGVGVLFSAVAVFGVEAVLTLIAALAGGLLAGPVLNEIVCVGSLLVLAIGLNLLGITHIKVMNLLPSMFFPIAFVPLLSLIM